MNQEIPNRFYRVSIKALILDETRTKFLVVQEDNGKWEFPGGGLDWGEKPHEGLARELQEEMGLEACLINQTPCYFLAQQKKPNDIYVANVFYEVTVKDLDFTPSEECVAIRFVTPEEVKSLETFPNVQELASMFDPQNHTL